jgi:mannose-6-phosphate isomerase-like protein (cupin superfamily)
MPRADVWQPPQSGQPAGVDDDVAALARCVGDVEWFGAKVWGQRPFVWRDRGCFTDLLTTEDVETMLRSAGRRPSFRLVRNGETLPPAASTRAIRIGGTVVDDAADLGRITALAGTGATIVLQGLHHLWPPLQRLCGQLEQATSHAAQANAYLSPPGAAALSHHRDTHEVLVLQVEGSKSWQIDGLGSIVMTAGDVTYLPAGTGHAAAAQDQHSLHVTIGVLATTYAAAVQRLVAAAGGAFGRPLPLGFARPDHEDHLADGMARMLDTAREHLAVVDPAEVATAEIRRATTRPRLPSPGTLRAAVDPAAVHDGVRLRVAGGPLRLTDEGATVVLEGGRRRLRLPAHTAAALEVVLDRGRVDVADLAGLDGPSRAVLARRLVREGFLEVDDNGREPWPASLTSQKVPRLRSASDRPSGS